MKIDFTYKYSGGGFDHALITKTPEGAEIEILFDGFEASVLYLNDLEFDLADDSIQGIYVDFGKRFESKPSSLRDVVIAANSQIVDIYDEIIQEETAIDRHVASFMYPASF